MYFRQISYVVMSLNVLINDTDGKKPVTGATYWKSDEVQKC